MVQNLLHLVNLAKKLKISIFCVGVIKFFFWALFLDVFFDADSDGIWILAFGPPGAEKSRFFWFWTPHREILLSHFFKKSKICSKVAQMGLILFRILHWLLWCSPFGSSSYHLRKNCQKPPKNRSKLTCFELDFLQTEIEIGKTVQTISPHTPGDDWPVFSLTPPLMGFSKKCPFWKAVFWPLTSNKCVGVF